MSRISSPRARRPAPKPAGARLKAAVAQAIASTRAVPGLPPLGHVPARAVAPIHARAAGVAPRPAPRGTVQVAPNRYIRRARGRRRRSAKSPPDLVICNVVPNGDGLYRLVPRTWERFERVDSLLSRKLGLGSRTDTLRRLIRGGFVGGARIAPRLYTLNLESYWAHYERCAENPTYWSNPKVRAEYWTAL